MNRTQIDRADRTDGREIQLERSPHAEKHNDGLPQWSFINTHAGVCVLVLQHLPGFVIQLGLARRHILQADVFLLTHNFLLSFHFGFFPKSRIGTV